MKKATGRSAASTAGSSVLRAILDHGTDVIFGTDEQLRIRFINRVPAGVGVEDAIGTSCLDYVPPEYHATVRQAADEVLRSGRPARYEIPARGPNDATAWYATQVLPLDPAAAPDRLLFLTEDITRERRLAEELRDSEARLRAIIEGTTDAIFVKDLNGRYVMANRAATQLTGRAAADVVGRDDSELLPAEVARAMVDHDRQVLDAGRVIGSRIAFRTPDGVQRSFDVTKGPLYDDDGRLCGLFGITRDLTDVLRSEEARRKAVEASKELLDLALNGAEAGSWETDLTTGAAHHDARTWAMLGYDPDEIAPTAAAWERLIHPQDVAAAEHAIRAYEAGETRYCQMEYRLRHKGGHWIWVLDRGKHFRDADGRPLRAAGAILDISDHKRLAAESVVMLRKLEALLGDLTRRVWAPAGDGQAGHGAEHREVRLTARNRDVLGLLAAGCTAAEIAARLGISEETAMTHRRNLMRKLGLRNKAELIRFAIERGIGAPP